MQNEEFCGDEGSIGAHCVDSISGAQRDIAKAQWDIDRVGQICETAQAFGDMKTDLEQLCQMAGPECTLAVQQQMDIFFSRIEMVTGQPIPASRGALIFKASPELPVPRSTPLDHQSE